MTTVLQGRAADAKFYTFKNGMASISEKLLSNITLHKNCKVEKSKVKMGNIKFHLLLTIQMILNLLME